MGFLKSAKERKRKLIINEKLRKITVNGVPLFGEDYDFNQSDKNDSTYLSDELCQDGELPLGWIGRHRNEIKGMEENVAEHVKAARDASKPVDERISEYRTAIELQEKMRDRFVSAGECYAKYYSDMWGHCHNSRCDDFDYIQHLEEELAKVLEDYDDLKKRETLLIGLDRRLMDLLLENDGIKQTDVYKEFDPVVKSDIKSFLYFWAKEEKIIRVKSGRTYSILVPTDNTEE